MPGFDYKFLEKPKRQLLCPLCRKPIREPVQVTTCGHRFCDTCLQKFLSEGVFKCLEDQLPLDYAKIYPDPELEVQVFKLGYMLHPQRGGLPLERATSSSTGPLEHLQLQCSPLPKSLPGQAEPA